MPFFYQFLRRSVVEYYLRYQVLTQVFLGWFLICAHWQNTLINWVVAFIVFAFFDFSLHSLIVFVGWNHSIIFILITNKNCKFVYLLPLYIVYIVTYDAWRFRLFLIYSNFLFPKRIIFSRLNFCVLYIPLIFAR